MGGREATTRPSTRINMKHRYLVLCAIAAFSVLISACDGGSSSGDVPVPKASVDAMLWKYAWEIGSASQRAALADGELTFAEYEAAAMATVQCIDDAGMQGEAKLDPKTGVYSLGARWQSDAVPDAAENGKRQEATDACYKDHWNAINQAWSAARQPSEADLARARAALGACLRENGADVPENPSSDDFAPYRSMPAFITCAQRVQDEFGLAYFAG